MVIEYARNVAGLERRRLHGVRRRGRPHPVIATMADQHDVVAGERDMGGTMRLGLYPAQLAEGSIVASVYGAPDVEERHRHRYEVNNAYREQLERRRAGLLRHVARTGGSWSTSSCRATCTRTSSPPRPTPSSGRGRRTPHPLFAGLVAAGLARRGIAVHAEDLTAAGATTA